MPLSSEIGRKIRIISYLVPVAETVFVIPAPHRVRDKLQRESRFFALDPCSFDPFDCAQGRLRSGQVSQG